MTSSLPSLDRPAALAGNPLRASSVGLECRHNSGGLSDSQGEIARAADSLTSLWTADIMHALFEGITHGDLVTLLDHGRSGLHRLAHRPAVARRGPARPRPRQLLDGQ